jgi:SAM-dependent methyltransferase
LLTSAAMTPTGGEHDARDAALEALRSQWDGLGAEDPLWAVLTEKGKNGRRWSVEEFLATGQVEIDELVAHLAAIGHRPGATADALDFGCGAGRLVQGLAGHFDRATGVDVAASMVATAERLNRRGEACRFVLNEEAHLRRFADESFDLVYSCRVLQHMPPALASGYIAEFVRLTRQGGVAVFQIPSRPARTAIGLAMRVLPAQVVERVRKMQMHGISPDAVANVVSNAGGEVIEVTPDRSAGPHWESFRYVVRPR